MVCHFWDHKHFQLCYIESAYEFTVLHIIHHFSIFRPYGALICTEYSCRVDSR